MKRNPGPIIGAQAARIAGLEADLEQMRRSLRNEHREVLLDLERAGVFPTFKQKRAVADAALARAAAGERDMARGDASSSGEGGRS